MGQDNTQAQQLPIFVTDGNHYCFKFLRLCRKPEVHESRTSCFRTLPELSIRGAGQKDRSAGDENETNAESVTLTAKLNAVSENLSFLR